MEMETKTRKTKKFRVSWYLRSDFEPFTKTFQTADELNKFCHEEMHACYQDYEEEEDKWFATEAKAMAFARRMVKHARVFDLSVMDDDRGSILYEQRERSVREHL